MRVKWSDRCNFCLSEVIFYYPDRGYVCQNCNTQLSKSDMQAVPHQEEDLDDASPAYISSQLYSLTYWLEGMGINTHTICKMYWELYTKMTGDEEWKKRWKKYGWL